MNFGGSDKVLSLPYHLGGISELTVEFVQTKICDKGIVMTEDVSNQFSELIKMRIPAKRAAYSDRTAWMMSILSEIAYERFDEESNEEFNKRLIDVATDLSTLNSEINNVDEIKKRLSEFAKSILENKFQNSENYKNLVLKELLKAGGFKLAGDRPIFEPSTDTQAFVAVRENGKDSFVVLCFRGTEKKRDWASNLNVLKIGIEDPNPDGDREIVGHMHRGFHNAYESVKNQINERLSEYMDIPLYVTGHSLGGALAVVATWYQSSHHLAACYTFGAPKVGDKGLHGYFRTPIYRVVNAADPVPWLPPSGPIYTSFRFCLVLLAKLIFLGKFVERKIGEKFCHYGDIRYIPFPNPWRGDTKKLLLRPKMGVVLRLLYQIKNQFYQLFSKLTMRFSKADNVEMIIKHHDIGNYRDNLRVIARNRNWIK